MVDCEHWWMTIISSSTDHSAANSPHSPTGDSSGQSSPNETHGTNTGPIPARRKLSAAAREFNPPPGESVAILQYPSILTPLSPTETKDETLQPDDAEDEEELQLFVDAAVASNESKAPTAREQSLLARALLRQVEWHLSNQNLWKDAFLQEEMKKDPVHEGYIPLGTIMGLKRVRSLAGGDVNHLIAALKLSEKLQLNPEQNAVKRLHPLQPYDQYKDSNRTIFVDRLPPGSTVRSVKQLFARFGKVVYVLRADHLLGASGMQVEEKGKLTPHTSPKLKPRSLSNSDVGTRVSPSLLARRLNSVGNGSSQGATATTPSSPSLSAMSGPLAHLSPAQRNRAIAASSPVVDPEAFSAAFIQFEKSACCKKAVSHIVAWNKQLKAQTPKGSPRVPLARRGSHGGVPGLPGEGAQGLGGGAALHALHSPSTPPRSRTIRISSIGQLASPVLSPAGAGQSGQTAHPPIPGLPFGPPQGSPASPPRSRLSAMVALTHGSPVLPQGYVPPEPSHSHSGSGVHSPPHDLPPAHPLHSMSPPPAGVPPRHTHSPSPGGALSPPRGAAASGVRERRAQSVTSPPPGPAPALTHAHSSSTSSSHGVSGGGGPSASVGGSRKMSAAESPPNFSPLSSPRAQGTPFHEQLRMQHGIVSLGGAGGDHGLGLPDFSLTTEMPLGAVAPPTPQSTPPIVAQLPEQFVGLFVMPKISYLKSLKQQAQGPQPGQVQARKSSAADKTSSSPAASPSHLEKGGQGASEKHEKDTAIVHRARRDSQPSPPHPPPQLHSSAGAIPSATTSPPPTTAAVVHRVLSASAPVFQPSVPLLVPAPVKPILAPGSTSPPLGSRALQKSNWRNDGNTPLLGPMPAVTAALVNAAGSGSGELEDASFLLSSPALGPTPSPTNDATADAKKAARKAKKAAAAKDVAAGATEGGDLAASSSSPAITAHSPSMRPVPRFSLTNTKRNSLGQVPENARQVVSRFALGPTSAEAIGFGGRGRTLAAVAEHRDSPVLTAAGGGRPVVVSSQ